MYVGTVVDKRGRDHDNIHPHHVAIDMVILNCNHDNVCDHLSNIS